MKPLHNLNLILAAAALLLGMPLMSQEQAPPSPPAPEEPAVKLATPKAEEEEAGRPASNGESRGQRRRTQRDAVVVFGKDAELKAGESAEAVVVIGGSASVSGKVNEAVVAIGGDVVMKEGGEASEVVSVLGGIKAEKGSTIHGEAVAVGGRVEREEGATIDGRIQDVDLGGFVLPKMEWLRSYFKHCVLLLRPLAPQVGWLWVVVGALFLFYLLIAAIFPRPVQACVEALTERPATTFLLGLLTKFMCPIIFTLLAVTGVGVFVIPFLAAALFLGAIVGKVAVLEWVGLRVGRPFNTPALENPLLGLVVGTVIIVLLYMVPVFGLLLFMVLSVWGLGAAVSAASRGFRGERRRRLEEPAYQTATGGGSQPVYAAAPAFAAAGGGGPIFDAGGAPFAGTAVGTPPLTAPGTPPVVPESLSYPRAGFWERLGAGFLDFVLLGIIGHFVGGAPLSLLVGLAYFSALWTWRGTTIGGIVLGLKVVRRDGEPVTFAVAIVRALAGAFSMIVLFLGVLWIAWDREKEGWHDKIAGTVVLRLPRGTPLVCL